MEFEATPHNYILIDTMKKTYKKKKRSLKRKKSRLRKIKVRFLLSVMLYLILYGGIRWQAIKASPLEVLPNFLDAKNNIVLLDSELHHQFFYYTFRPLLRCEEALGTLSIYYID